MPVRALVELLHIAAGLVTAALIAALSAWAYPRATADIWLVAAVSMAIVALMGVGPLRRAWAADTLNKETH
jgi:hypothetical protein